MQACDGSRQAATIEGFIVAPTVQDRKLKTVVAQECRSILVGIMDTIPGRSLSLIQGTYTLLRSRVEDMPQQAQLDTGVGGLSRSLPNNLIVWGTFFWAERAKGLEVSSVRPGPIFWRLRHEAKMPLSEGASIFERFQRTPMCAVIRCCWAASSAIC
jgi:two-component system, OmpR family, phosphate regulon sensor histidine kinase PhoR